MNYYKVTKIGLVNFWYFDYEEFLFSSGKILLRGENGSGKSVTMQSFIPLILDGNKMPNRLDPFGSREKKIEDYILGPADGEQKDESISYLYMETYNEELDKYITIGIGFKAKKGRNTDFWGFALKDGKRIGIDFVLYKDYGSKVLLSKNELKSKLMPDNLFVQTQKEYKSMVNDLLFKFQDMDSYDEFINILLQLRSSKLSKDYNPSKLMTILSGVLQPLTSLELQPLSDAIEETNEIKEKQEKLKSNLKALNNFLKTYRNYNEIMLYKKAYLLNNEDVKIKNKVKEVNELEKKKVCLSEEYDEVKKILSDLEIEYAKNASRLDVISDSGLQSKVESLESINVDVEFYNKEIERIKSQIKGYENDEVSNRKVISEIEKDIKIVESDISSLIDDISHIFDEVKLEELSTMLNKDNLNFEYLNERIKSYEERVKNIKIKLEEKEKLEYNLNEKEEEENKLRKNLEFFESEKEKCEKKFILEKDNFKDRINEVNSKNEIIKLDEDARTKIFNYINFYSNDNYNLAKDIYRKISLSNMDIVKKKINLLNVKIDNLNEVLNEKNAILLDLKNNEEALIEEDETCFELNKLSVPFVPLYKAIEFKDNVSESDRNKLEELLSSLNILNAKIVPDKFYSKVSHVNGIFLKPSIKKDKNLLEYFNVVPTDGVSREEISEVLASISSDSNSQFFINSDSFKLDFIVGNPNLKYESKYIGLLKRTLEQKRKISEKEEEINNLLEEINSYRNAIGEEESKIDVIKREEELFPASSELEKISISIRDLEKDYDREYKSCSLLELKIDSIKKDILSKISEINVFKEGILIPLNVEAYSKSLGLINVLLNDMQKLEILYEKLSNKKENKDDKVSNLNEILIYIENSKKSLDNNNLSLARCIEKRDSILEILNKPDNKELLNEVKLLTRRQNEIPKEKDKYNIKVGSLEANINSVSDSILNGKKLIDSYNLIYEIRERVFKKELELGYVFKEDVLVKDIISKLKSKEKIDVVTANNNFNEAYNNYRNELNDYHFNSKTLFSDNEALFNEYVSRGADEEELKSILESAVRQDIICIYRGREVNALELRDLIEDAINASEQLITEQEKRLFEEILLKTVGNKIRDRIDSSNSWVKNMNEIMESTQIDSNLSFHLEWKSKEAFTEDEMGTKELIRLFRIDPGMISKADSDKLIEHFRSKIKRELEFSKETNLGYSDIIFKVLDYRSWFEFKLYYKRKGSDKKELTNRMFSVFSGGERAKSMYVPLFAAVYAKLQSASIGALRLIALDEAFAGVDNVNIREMFDILSKLELDYILTSQSLWGDYDTVDDLAICELFKDEKEKLVAVRNYHWNGKLIEVKDSNGY